MKNRFLIFLKKYYILIFLSLVHPLAMATTQHWGRIVLWSKDFFGDVLTYDVYFICFIPIAYIIYGCITYLYFKKAFIPNAIPTIIFSTYFCCVYLKDFDLFSILFFTLFPIVFSIAGTAITALIYYIVKSIKED